jgi:hypothetical protein
MGRKANNPLPREKYLRFVYMAEFNRCVGDNINNVVRRLRRRGYEVALLRHKTTVLIRRPAGSTFREFRNDLAEMVQPVRGSMILSSTSGKFWLLDNKGNQPGKLRRVDLDDL